MGGTRASSKAATWLVFFLTLEMREAIAGDKPQPAVCAEPCRRIVVSIPDRKLVLLEGNDVRKVYPIAVGAPGTPTPAGTYTIITRVPNPSYCKSGKVIPPGTTSPVGTRWMGLSLKGYGIHGTNRPSSIGKAASHGCIRLRNEDIEQLFELIQIGDIVELHADAEALPQITRPAATPVQKAVLIAAVMAVMNEGARAQR